jgi:tellurite resistance protein
MEKLNKDVFVALAAVAWADGQLDPDEADAIVRAAVDCGLELDAISEIESATKERIDLGTIDRKGLSKQDRMFVYAVACWIAQLDGSVTDEEQATVSALGEKLGVPERARRVAEKLAKEIAALPEGDRPARYDLDQLHKRIGDRLQPV